MNVEREMTTSTKDAIEMWGAIAGIVVCIFVVLDFIFDRWRYIKRISVWLWRRALKLRPEYSHTRNLANTASQHASDRHHGWRHENNCEVHHAGARPITRVHNYERGVPRHALLGCAKPPQSAAAVV